MPVKGYSLAEEKVRRSGISATKVDADSQQGKSGPGAEIRRWKDVSGIIEKSGFQEGIKKKGYEIFRNLFEAEARCTRNLYPEFTSMSYPQLIAL